MTLQKNFDLGDKVILVTGAAGHLGHAISGRLVKAGAFVYLNGRTPETLKELESDLSKYAGGCLALPFDISDQKALRENVRTIKEKSGRLDGLVNNAFVPMGGSVDDATYDDFQKCFSVNVSALFDLTQQCLPLLERKHKTDDYASIVNIASMYGVVSPDPSIYGDSGMNNPPFYGASKAAIIQLSRYFAGHVTDRGIRTNSVSPGAFPPPAIIKDMPDFHKQLCKKNPMGRIGNPDEVAAAVHFLLSANSSYVNGINLPVDGGWTAW